MCGRFSWWKYGCSAARHPIDALEGDTVLKAARDLGHLWRERIVPFSIDNQAFQRSAVKGWSRAERISVLVRSLFAVAVSSGCIFEFSWISTHDNIYADALSRPDPLSSFLALVSAPASQLKEGSVLRRASDAGKVKPLEPHFSGQPPAPSSPPSSGEWDAAGSDATLLSPGGSRLGIGTPQEVLKTRERPWPDSMRSTRCPVCKGPAEWACTERRDRRCDAVRCPKKCTDPTCWCSLDDISFLNTFPKCPSAVTFILMGKPFSSDEAGDGPSGRSARMPVALSVSYPRASIFTGIPNESVRSSVDSILSDRLSVSSHASISAALSHWSVVALRHAWPRVIVADDPLRGGKLATFVSYLVDETELKSVSISNYVWALRSWFKLQRQPDPIYGVLEWDEFMQSVDVVAWVQREPRKAVPVALLRRALEAVDLNNFAEVQTALLMLILFFTFARSETPCPKAFSGAGAFDPTKHLQVCDVEVRWVDGRPCVAVRLKSIKQDPRMERAEAAGNEDWVLIGNVEGLFSILTWISRFWNFFPADGLLPPRSPEDPFFSDDDSGGRPLTYSNAQKGMRRLYAKVIPSSEAATYGLHGLRVEAYNRASAHDPELAVAHGGWSSEAHTRYKRFLWAQVLALPSAMVAGVESESSTSGEGGALSLIEPPPPELSHAPPSGRRLGRARSGGGASTPTSGTPSVGAAPASPSVASAPARSRAGRAPSGVRLWQHGAATTRRLGRGRGPAVSFLTTPPSVCASARPPSAPPALSPGGHGGLPPPPLLRGGGSPSLSWRRRLRFCPSCPPSRVRGPRVCGSPGTSHEAW